MTDTQDLIVVGAGPAGLAVASEAAYHELGTALVLEKGETHNQTVHKYYPDNKRVDAAYLGQEAVCAGVLCFRDTTKPNFLAVIDDLLGRFRFPIRYGVAVDSIRRAGDGFDVSTGNGDLFRARTVVIAIGRMGKPNRPEFFAQIPAEAKKHVHFDIRNVKPEGKRMLVVGGGNSAIEFALCLGTKGSVTVSYRQKEFARLNPMNLKLLEEEEAKGTIRVVRESNVTKIDFREGRPLVFFRESPEEAFDEVIFGIGGSSPAAFLQNAGVELDARGMPKTDEWLETSVPGLFVAGELSVPPGKGSIIVSFNSGKKIVERLLQRAGKPRRPEMVSVT